jgi:acyl-CoA thioester hydrolase
MAFSISITPTWRDQDALGHVNNAVYSTYLEIARRGFWEHLTGERCEMFPFLLARTEIDFRAPSTWNDDLAITVTVSRIGNSSFELAYTFDTAQGVHVADAKTVLVMYDHEEERTLPLSEDIRSRLENAS